MNFINISKMNSQLLLLTALISPICSMTIGPNYEMLWEIIPATENEKGRAIFEVEVKTTGFVGLGFSPTGSMNGADIVTGGVYPNGTTYLTDRHGIGFVNPPEDTVQDYQLLDAWENSTHTYLKFSRLLHTCDEQDLAITDDTMRVIWSFGETDNVTYHGPDNRGVVSVNLIDGHPTPPDLSKFKTWVLASNITMPKNDTTYWCNFHKAPKLDRKHQIVGFMAYLEDENALKHTHHVDVYRCIPPDGEDPDEYFKEYEATSGYDCYYSTEFFPRDYCELFEVSWSISGMVTVFPDHLGIPFGVVENEYYMTEIHYDNPQELGGLRFRTGMELYYSDELREYDVGFLQVGQKIIYTHMIPPNSVDFLTPAHCHRECTKWIPEEGLNIFNILLHSHLAGRKIRLRHFRDGIELPWIASDDFYDFNYQQNKALPNDVKLLPGDELTLECTYDSTWREGKATIGGRSTREEMCMSFILYYPLIEPVNQCGSFIPIRDMLDYLGIENITLSQGELDPTVIAPAHLAGKKYTQVIEEMNWDDEKRKEFQNIMNGEHDNFCFPKFGFDPFIKNGYPDFQEEFKPPNECLDSRHKQYQWSRI